jgi:cell division protein FtsI (penicillin-binding protein 3)
MGLLGRIVYLSVVQRDFLQKQGRARSLRTVAIPADRGMIRDRHGYPLAISSPVASVWVDPKQLDFDDLHWRALADILDESLDSIKQRTTQYQQRDFMYLKRHLSPELGEKIQQLKLSGVYIRQEFRRYYPMGEVTAQLLGFTNIDEQGQEGLELALNPWLQGVPGKQQVVRDRLGHVVSMLGTIQEAQPGRDIYLSIDQRIQHVAYQQLKKAVDEHQAATGSLVILDVKTGEVLAMVNAPSFNPNQRHKRRIENFRNRAVTDMFEPGSTLKALSVANALEQGNFTADSVIDTSPGWLSLNGELVDDHRNHGQITLTEILQRSSNVGMAKVTLSLPANSLWNLLYRLGFGKITESYFPGEVAGLLPFHRKWSDFALATLSFGYGMTTTALQLAEAYSVLAANGVKYPVSLLRLDHLPKGESILDAGVANTVKEMLEAVVEKNGTGRFAKIPGYRVMGKTGTVRIVGEHGYDKKRHIALFVGAAPSSDPRLLAVVVINDPKKGSFYGGSIAAPVFSTVVGQSLHILQVPMDEAVA